MKISKTLCLRVTTEASFLSLRNAPKAAASAASAAAWQLADEANSWTDSNTFGKYKINPTVFVDTGPRFEIIGIPPRCSKSVGDQSGALGYIRNKVALSFISWPQTQHCRIESKKGTTAWGIRRISSPLENHQIATRVVIIRRHKTKRQQAGSRSNESSSLWGFKRKRWVRAALAQRAAVNHFCLSLFALYHQLSWKINLGGAAII